MKGYKYYSVIMFVLAGLLTASVVAQDAPGREQEENIPPDRISIHQLKRMMDAKEEVVIIDNRAGSAYVGSTVKIKGAIHITVDDLEQKMNDLPKNKLIVTYCT